MQTDERVEKEDPVASFKTICLAAIGSGEAARNLVVTGCKGQGSLLLVGGSGLSIFVSLPCRLSMTFRATMMIRHVPLRAFLQARGRRGRYRLLALTSTLGMSDLAFLSSVRCLGCRRHVISVFTRHDTRGRYTRSTEQGTDDGKEVRRWRECNPPHYAQTEASSSITSSPLYSPACSPSYHTIPPRPVPSPKSDTPNSRTLASLSSKNTRKSY